MERAEKLFNGSFASGFDEITNRPLQLSQTFCCFKPRGLSESFSRTHCKGITSLDPVGCFYIAVFAKNLLSTRETIVPGNFPPALLAFNHFDLSHCPNPASISRGNLSTGL